MVRENFFRVSQIRNRTADFEDFRIGAGGEIQFLHGGFQEGDHLRGHLAVRLELLGPQLGVRLVLAALATERDGPMDPGANLGGGFAFRGAGEGLEGNGRDINVEIDPVEQRAGDFRQVGGDFGRWTAATSSRIREVAAGAALQSIVQTLCWTTVCIPSRLKSTYCCVIPRIRRSQRLSVSAFARHGWTEAR